MSGEQKETNLQTDAIDDDDDLKLPADTLAILNEFLQNKKQTEQLELQADGENSSRTFEEDWVNEIRALKKPNDFYNFVIFPATEPILV